ncbi:hypothetical protein [Gloeothece verrucosa]|uniref:Uncharacterized protein n=1 Tax=Gloeothece verrucosa (strain PCC 7822) TaxID=497965 RepID=E0U875_GLOV7|nr:hypothetical protein [Gloeothece verrucosa]ADN17280.1 conserved hypothetical protein [Gloeothece verrucosa PCC 7822]
MTNNSVLLNNKKNINRQDSIIKHNNNTWSNVNLTSLKDILSYLSYLKAREEISDKTFEALVKYTCANFIEYEIEQKIQTLIENKLEDKLEKFFLKKIIVN